MLKKGEKTREHILLCAEKVFSQKGYYQSQISDIAVMAKVAKGTLYQYFTNKENLFTTMIDNYATQWENEVYLDIENFLGTGSAEEYAHAYLSHRLSRTILFFSKNQDRANIILRMSLGLNEGIEQVIRIFEEKVMKAIIHDIELGQKFNHISKRIDSELYGNAILGSILRISYFYFVVKKESYIKRQEETFTNEVISIVENTLKMFHTD